MAKKKIYLPYALVAFIGEMYYNSNIMERFSRRKQEQDNQNGVGQVFTEIETLFESTWINDTPTEKVAGSGINKKNGQRPEDPNVGTLVGIGENELRIERYTKVREEFKRPSIIMHHKLTLDSSEKGNAQIVYKILGTRGKFNMKPIIKSGHEAADLARQMVKSRPATFDIVPI